MSGTLPRAPALDWSGATGAWTDYTQWTPIPLPNNAPVQPDEYPEAGQAAYFPGGGDVSAAGQSASFISTSGNLTLQGGGFSTGELEDGGVPVAVTITTGGVTIPFVSLLTAGDSLTLAQGGSLSVQNSILHVNGSVSVDAGTTLSLGGAAALEVGGLNVQGTAQLSGTVLEQYTIGSAGLVLGPAALLTAYIDAVLLIGGPVAMQAGATLDAADGVAFTQSAGAVSQISGQLASATGVTFTGGADFLTDGTMSAQSASVAAALTVAAGDTFEPGTLTVGPGNAAASVHVTDGGTIASTGVNLGGTATLDSNGGAAGSWTDSGTFDIGARGAFSLRGAFFTPHVLALGAGGNFSGDGTVLGSTSAASTIANAGTVVAASGGTLYLAPSVSGTGTLVVGAGGALTLGGSVAEGQTIAFAGGSGLLTLAAAAAMDGTITGIGAGSSVTIDLPGIAATQAAVAGNAIVVLDGGASVLSLAEAGIPAGENVAVGADGRGGGLLVIGGPAGATPGAEDFPLAVAVPAAITLAEGVATPIPGVSITDTQAGPATSLSITVSDTTGGLSATAAAGGSVSVGGGGKTVLIEGTLAQVNAALASLSFTGAAIGSDSVLINALDSLGDADTAAVALSTLAAPIVLGGGATATTDTVAGASGVIYSVPFGVASLAAQAAPLLADVTPANALFVTSPGRFSMSPAQAAIVDVAGGAASVTGNGGAADAILAGAGNFDFTAGAGSGGAVFAGGGDDFIYDPPGGGDWSIALGDGADTVVAAAGDDTVNTGTGGSFVFLGAGATEIGSGGADTVVGATGAATVFALGANSDEVFALGGPLAFVGGAGASTVVAGAVAATLYGGTGGTLAFTDGATDYLGGTGTDTLVGLAGSLSVQAGAGGGEFFGGAAGGNLIEGGAGNVTAFGGGNGDVLQNTGAASDLFAGGVGAETLNGTGSTGANTFFAGYGPEVLAGGGGSTALVAGSGNDTLIGGAGVTLFLFVDGRAGGADIIGGFDPSHDFVMLAGYATSPTNVLAAATSFGGSTTIDLPDGTQITFAGITQLNANSFA